MSSRRRILLGAATLVIVVTVVAALFSSRESATPTSLVQQDQLGPVLLVSGYGGGTAAVDDLAAALRAGGRDATVIPVVGDGTGDLREQAQSLRTAADAALASGAPSVDVVGFSAGGVVVSVWAEEFGGAFVARRIVTLGAPHHGSELAAIGGTLTPEQCPEGCRQLAPGSALLLGLDEATPGPRWTTVSSADDQVVTPESAQLEGAVNVSLQDVCPDAFVEHDDLPRAPVVRGIVALALDVIPLDASPDTSSCADITAAGHLGAAAR